MKFKMRNLDPDYRVMARIEKNMLRDVGLGVEDGAKALVTAIRGNWSLNSPSAVGSPPAMVTHNLDSAVKVDEKGRDEYGKFADTENTRVMFVRIDTSEGDNPMGRGNYAEVLESKLDRPFIEPAITQVAHLYGMLIKKRISL